MEEFFLRRFLFLKNWISSMSRTSMLRYLLRKASVALFWMELISSLVKSHWMYKDLHFRMVLVNLVAYGIHEVRLAKS